MATVLEEYAIVCFWWANGLNAKDIHKEMFRTGSRNSLKDVGKTLMMPS
jgi:hypothetical protein